jgi:hypothetical protein
LPFQQAESSLVSRVVDILRFLALEA